MIASIISQQQEVIDNLSVNFPLTAREYITVKEIVTLYLPQKKRIRMVMAKTVRNLY